jgi:hypothetical protein
MKMRLLSLLVLLLSPGMLLSQTYSKDEVDRMILAYTFYIKQKVSLETVSETFPSLKEDVTHVTNDWNREFKPALENIDSLLTNILKSEWKKQKDQIYDKFSRTDNRGISEDNAHQFISVVNERASGRIQSPVLETLLVFNPVYQKKPELEFREGYTKSICIKEINKQLPLNVKIVYPKSWREFMPKKKTDPLFKCISGFAFGQVSMTLKLDMAKKDYTKETVKQLLSKEALLKGIPLKNQVLFYDADVTIDNCPASLIAFYHDDPVLKTSIIEETYVTFYKNYRLTFAFTIVTTLNRQETLLIQERHQKLIKKISDNIVILSQWGL